MEFEWEPAFRQFRDELRAFIREWRTPELLAEYAATYGADGPEADTPAFDYTAYWARSGLMATPVGTARSCPGP